MLSIQNGKTVGKVMAASLLFLWVDEIEERIKIESLACEENVDMGFWNIFDMVQNGWIADQDFHVLLVN